MAYRFSLAWILSLVPVLGGAQVADSNFTIREFQVERVYDQPSNPVWEPLDKTQDAVIPAKIMPGQFTLRRKFGAREYALFSGRMLDGAYENLFAYRLDSAGSRDRSNLKFYSRQGDDWFHDLEDVYFLEDLVLAGQPLLYFKQSGHWQELKALPRKPMRLVLRSTPAGARVFIDGKDVGSSPVTVMGLVEPHVNISMSLSGYYPREEPVGFEQTSEAIVNWTLGRLLPADTVRAIDSLPLDALAKADAPSLQAYEARQDIIRAQITAVEARRDSLVAKFDSLYPALKSQEEFERSLDFQTRRSAYQHARDSQQTMVTAPLESVLHNLHRADQGIEDNKEPLERVLLHAELGETAPELMRYDADHEAYPFKVKISQPPFWFHYSGTLALDPEKAQRLKAHPDSLRILLQYWNLSLHTDSAQAFFTAIDSIRCTFAGQSLRVKDDTLAYSPTLTNLAGFKRNQDRMQDFNQKRLAEAKALERAKIVRAAAAKKAKWKKIRVFSGLGLTAISLGLGWTAFVEKDKADTYYSHYQRALSSQQAWQDRHAAEVHDQNFWTRAWAAGAGLSLGVGISVF